MVPEELVINFDQFGCHLLPTGQYTMEEKGAKQVKIAKGDDKRELTVVLSTTLAGDLLPYQVRFKIKIKHSIHLILIGYLPWENQ